MTERIVRDQLDWWRSSGFTPDEAYEALTGIACVRSTWDDVHLRAMEWARGHYAAQDMAADGSRTGTRRLDVATVEKTPRHRKYRVVPHAA